MPPLLIAGYWPTTYFPRGYWEPNYWPHWGEEELTDGEPIFGRWQPMRMPWIYRDDDDEVLVILG